MTSGDDPLRDWIKGQIDAGVPEDTIRERALEAGWDPGTVDTAITSISTEQDTDGHEERSATAAQDRDRTGQDQRDRGTRDRTGAAKDQERRTRSRQETRAATDTRSERQRGTSDDDSATGVAAAMDQLPVKAIGAGLLALVLLGGAGFLLMEFGLPGLSSTNGSGSVTVGAVFSTASGIEFLQPFQQSARLGVNSVDQSERATVTLQVAEAGPDVPDTTPLESPAISTVIGPERSSNIPELHRFAEEHEKALVSYAASQPRAANATTLRMFRTLPTERRQGLALAQAMEEDGISSVTMVTSQDFNEAELGLIQAFQSTYSGQVTDIISYSSTSDFRSQIGSISPTSDAVVFYATVRSTAPVLEAAQAEGLFETKQVYLTHNQASTDLIDQVNEETAALLRSDRTTGIHATVRTDHQAYTRFEEQYQQEHGSIPQRFRSLIPANAYDAGVIAALAALQAARENSSSREAVPAVANSPGTQVSDPATAADYILNGTTINYQGAGSDIQFNDAGADTTSVFARYQFTGDGLTEGEPFRIQVTE